MHFRKGKVDKGGDGIPELPALQGHEEIQKGKGVPCLAEVKLFLRDCFLEGFDKKDQKCEKKKHLND